MKVELSVHTGTAYFVLLFPHRKGLPYAKELEPGVEEAAEQVTDCSLIENTKNGIQ